MISLILVLVIFITVCVLLLISLSKHKTKCFLQVVLFLGLFGIICAIAAFYMKYGFDLYLNLFFLFPCYAFILWIMWKFYPIVKHVLKEC